MSANDFVDWTDANGDQVRFRFTDQTIGATSGRFRLAGVEQADGATVDVTDQQLLAGALVWVAGGASSSDQISIVARDPFGDSVSRSFAAPSVGGSLTAMMAALITDSAPEDDATLAMADTLSQDVHQPATCALACAPNGSNASLMAAHSETYLGWGLESGV